MGDVRGSLWRKWDFHVHTPYSILNNGYGFNPYDDVSDASFDNFVRELFTRAIDKGVAAIGITDYFCIEGYKRIRNDYLECEDALARVFQDDDERAAVKNILVFPNIEFRTNEFIGKKSHSLNYHVLFSDEVPIETIEEFFLQRLNIITGTGEYRPLTRRGLIDLGMKSAKGRGDSADKPYSLGLNLVTISRSEVRQVLEKCSDFKNRYLIAVPVDEDLSKVSWEGRDYPTRREIYHECDCFLTSSAGTRNWALAKDEERDRIEEFGSIKPCVWGSDAHNYESLFEPSEQRYCWLKADVTFEGLRQILSEPELRVCIQREPPHYVDLHKVIDSLRVNDLRLGSESESAFQIEPVVFNEGLTCIIGGRSTGKSLLIKTLAHAIDDKYAKSQEDTAGVKPLPQLPDAKVTWADGTTGRRRFIYIPQAYLNRLVDDPQHRTQTDEMIENVLLQDETCKAAYDEMTQKLVTIKGEVNAVIDAYRNLQDRRDELRRLLSIDGSSEMFSSTIARLEQERDAMAKKSRVTEAEVRRYEELGVAIDQLAKEIITFEGDLQVLRDMPTPIVVVPGHVVLRDGKPVHSFAGLSAASVRQIDSILAEERITVEKLWVDAYGVMLSDIKSLRESKSAMMDKLEVERAPLKTKVEQSVQLREIASRLEEERRKGATAKEREAEIERCEDGMSSLNSQLLGLRDKRLAAIESYCAVVNGYVGGESKLEFSACPVWKRDDFITAFLGQVDNRNLSQFKQVYGIDLREIRDEELSSTLFTNLWTALENPSAEGGITTKSGYTFWTAIQLLTDNWYNVHYVVKSEGDEMDSMSPGKKSLVLLELIIDLDKEMCPLLIDQPEDDLDNRSVYKELVAYIRRRKTRRQIIVVTHNANVVLGADAEEIIIANQNGVGTPNRSRRFEYRSGAIENDSAEPNRPRVILYDRGLQTQMCDILEGGPEAMERRRRKYTSASLEWEI